ncbi:MAG: aldehyde dehydrogenase family protein [Bacteroidetes bacterium]|nr:aldehyde dehydrogenase family protein [Bacteroidota bacterium]
MITRPDLHQALSALRSRIFFTAYPEHPGAYAETEKSLGLAAFEQHLNKPFADLLQPGTLQWAGEERSPWTMQPLGITYPVFDAGALLLRARTARHSLSDLTPEKRASILIDALELMRARFFELAFATQHTSGQSFMMAFQASGPHTADRALEALASAYEAITYFPASVWWEKPLGKTSVKLEKTYKAVGRGIALSIGCSTFPTWNSLPGIFANLMCGNPVIWKPHPGAVLPAAIAASCIQDAFAAAGSDAMALQLAPDTAAEPLAFLLAQHPLVQIIDYTGGSSFGQTLESLPGKTVFTEKAGVNSVLIESVKNLDEVLQNLAFSVCLYSGQMCTAPQNFFVPAQGVWDGEKHIPASEVATRLADAIKALTENPKTGAGTLATLQNERTLQRVANSSNLGAEVLLPSASVAQPDFPQALSISPVLLKTTASEEAIYASELFGPISIVVVTTDRDEALQLITQLARKQGAITCALYTTDAAFEKKALLHLESAFVQVSVNLTGHIWVNQHAAFSDLHVTGGNPAGNATFSNPDFVNRRFVWLSHRKAV